MTYIEELITQLRRDDLSWVAPITTKNKAADALESLTQQLAERDAEAAHIKEVEFPRKVEAVAAGWKLKCDALQAQLAAAQGQLQRAFNWFETIDKTACESEDSINKSRKLFAVARDARIAMAALKAAPIPQPEPVTYTPPKIIDPDAPHPCFN